MKAAFLVLVMFLAVCVAAVGAAMFFAGAMSDSSNLGEAYGRWGLVLLAGGLTVLGFAIMIAIVQQKPGSGAP